MKVAQLCGFIFLFGSLSCVQERGEATAPSDALTTRTAALEQAREPVDRRAEALWQAIQQSADAKQRVRLFVRVEGDRAPLRTFVTARGAHIAYEYTLLPDVVAVREFPMSQLDDLTRIKGVTELLPDGTKHAIMTESLGQIQGDPATMVGLSDGSGVIVCVLDTGINKTHPAFAGALVAEKDFSNGDDDATDDQGHGSHVSGTVLSRDLTWVRLSWNDGMTLLPDRA